MKSKLFSILFFSVLIFSCRDAEEVGAGNFSEGAFVTCEGNFAGGTGTVTFINEELPEPLQDIFATQNGGAAIGNILQSATIIGDKMYLVVNNANKVVVVDAKTFKFEAEITGFALPRYLIDADNGKAFVSQWGTDGLSGSVAVVNLSTNKIEKTIAGIGSGCERMVKVGSSIWVANSGGFGVDSTIVEIGISVENKLQSIPTPKNPASFVADKFGDIWLVARGEFGAPGSFGLINFVSKSVGYPAVLTKFLGSGIDDLVRNADGDLFFNDAENGEIMVKRASKAIVQTFAKGSFYDLAVSPTGEIWATDAKGFVGEGEVVVFKNDGTKRTSFKTGIIPGGVVFK